MLDPAWLTALATLAALIGGLCVWLGRTLWRLLRRTTRFLDDFFGEPAHDGLPARPGVMARLTSVEELGAQVAAEMAMNHGTSVRDVVHKTGADVTHLKDQVRDLSRQMEDLRAAISRRNQQ